MGDRAKLFLQFLGIIAGICVLLAGLALWHGVGDKYQTLDRPELTKEEKQRQELRDQADADRRRQERIEEDVHEINRKLGR
jgi:hypothetical protein